MTHSHAVAGVHPGCRLHMGRGLHLRGASSHLVCGMRKVACHGIN